jgi:penicillin-binding protein 1A
MSDVPLPPPRETPPDWLMKPPPPAPPAVTAVPSWRRRVLRVGLPAVGLLGCYGIGLGYGSWTRVCAAERCPSISRLVSSYKPQQSSKVYAADGRLITEFFFERRTVMPLPEIPMSVRQAFIATEDKRFYSHHGIDYIRIFGAVKANLLTLRYSQGFSTITMQLARNVFPDQISREKKLTRKLKEARVSRELERTFPKDTILQFYLNQINLGPGAYGVEAASQVFFGKSVREVNVAEAALLAAMAKLPGYYNPRTHPDRAVQRRNVVLTLMREQGYLTRAEAERWKAYPLLLTSRRTSYGDVAPYFVEHIRQDLEARYGRRLYEGGLLIYTTLDLDVQEAAERALQAQLDAIEAGVYSPGGKFPGGTTYRDYLESLRGGDAGDRGPFTPYLQGAMVAMDARTGYVLALIGGRDFTDSKYNRATQAIRQPGSTFKPFVYAAAIRAGHNVTEILDDSPLTTPVMQLDSTLWEPRDYDDTTLGFIPMRRSLYESRNLSTIKLGMQIGEAAVIGEARRFGITTPIPPYPSIHIGSAGVRPIEMIASYSAFATLGTRVSPVFVLRVEDREGTILWQPSVRREEVIDPAHAWLVTDMLRDVVRRGTAFSAVWRGGFTLPSGGKTGTTDDHTDAWYIGFTPEIVAGIWVGYDFVQRIMDNAGGGRIVAPAWASFMRAVYDRRPPPQDWERPDALVTREVDRSTGFLATPFCPLNLRQWDWFFPGTEPSRVCPVHSVFGPALTP